MKQEKNKKQKTKTKTKKHTMSIKYMNPKVMEHKQL